MDTFLILILCFTAGYVFRGLITPATPLPEDGFELLWFNPQKFQWERVQEDSPITSSDRVVMGIPLAFAEVKEKNDE